MAHRFYCGTSGWNYKHWIEILYPKGLAASKWLQRYTEVFDTVEINFSFYRLPPKDTFEKWRALTPDGFTFAVKASRYLTHVKRLNEPEEPLERLMSSASGLQEKLGPFLYQFPPNWRVNLERLAAFLKILPKEVRHVFEFRDPSWQSDSVFDLLREHGAAYCIMSSPDLPCHMISTAEFAYIRMHNGGHESEGSYTEDGLHWWAEHCRRFLEHGDLYVYFNNDYKGYAVYNASRLREVVES